MLHYTLTLLNEEQNKFVSIYFVPYTGLHQRSTKETPRSKIVTQYIMRKEDGELIIVCAATFQSVTSLSMSIVTSISHSK